MTNPDPDNRKRKIANAKPRQSQRKIATIATISTHTHTHKIAAIVMIAHAIYIHIQSNTSCIIYHEHQIATITHTDQFANAKTTFRQSNTISQRSQRSQTPGRNDRMHQIATITNSRSQRSHTDQIAYIRSQRSQRSQTPDRDDRKHQIGTTSLASAGGDGSVGACAGSSTWWKCEGSKTYATHVTETMRQVPRTLKHIHDAYRRDKETIAKDA